MFIFASLFGTTPSGRHINKDAELAFICGYRNLANSNYDAITQWSSSLILVCIVQFNISYQKRGLMHCLSFVMGNARASIAG